MPLNICYVILTSYIRLSCLSFQMRISAVFMENLWECNEIRYVNASVMSLHLNDHYLPTCKLQLSIQLTKVNQEPDASSGAPCLRASPSYLLKCVLGSASHLCEIENTMRAVAPKKLCFQSFYKSRKHCILTLEHDIFPSLTPAWLLRSSTLHLFLSHVNKKIPNSGHFKLWKITTGWLILSRFSVKAPHVL